MPASPLSTRIWTLRALKKAGCQKLFREKASGVSQQPIRKQWSDGGHPGKCRVTLTRFSVPLIPNTPALGQRVRELRTKQGYSQEAFADRCGVHRTFMGTIERGESNLSFQNLVKVAVALDITLSQLLSGIEKKAAGETLTATPKDD